MSKWPTVKLKGASQHMPRTCPNCLNAADTEWRYCFTRTFLLYMIDRTRYWQTFYYCADCSSQLEGFFRQQKWSSRLLFVAIPAGLVAFFAGIFLADALVTGRSDSEVTLRGFLFFVPFVAYLGLAWLGFRMLKRHFQRKHPQKPNQAAWGPAVYYCGDGAMGFGSAQNRVYRAARSEWLRELVQANPDQVDDATYLRMVGTAKPSAVAAKPFAG